MLLLVLVVAGVYRFYRLGSWPPGLYRDEAYNGLDALRVLDGQHALFFPANNGREPGYIYATAAAVAVFGRTALAVRLAAAVAGTLTTLATYGLAAEWFGRRVGLLAAALWAVTLWPVHLSRIGLRPILLAPLLALAFWLGTRAARRRSWRWGALAGLAYGATLYTYLAARFTPVLLAAIFLYLLLTGRVRFSRASVKRWWAAAAGFAGGTAVAALPFALLVLRQPEVLVGRAGQVSVLNPAVNGGALWQTLWQQTAAALGMFIWRGDTILRHNPAGRPVFDWLMAAPFLLGLLWCLRHWRRPAAAALLLWLGVMLGPTILAEDTPHFLRASGLLPAVVIAPALGLDWLAGRLAARGGAWRKTAVGAAALLLLGSAGLTARDYAAYSQDPQTGYLFEAAARTLAEEVNQAGLPTRHLIDQRFWSGWPAIPFLVTEPRVSTFTPQAGLPPLALPTAVYAWPYGALDFLPAALPEAALVWLETGPAARGDLEPASYALYTRYLVQPAQPWPPLASFGGQLALLRAGAVRTDDGALQVDLVWAADAAADQRMAALTAFVHVVGADGRLVAQDDAPPGRGAWPAAWWRPGLQLHERRRLPLPPGFDPARHQVWVGLYDAAQTRLAVTVNGTAVGDAFRVAIGD